MNPFKLGRLNDSEHKLIEETNMKSLKGYWSNGKYSNIFAFLIRNNIQTCYCNICKLYVKDTVTHLKSKKHSKLAAVYHKKYVLQNRRMNENPVVPKKWVDPKLNKKADIQYRLDKYKASPVLGIEYIVELRHYNSFKNTYLCLLCNITLNFHVVVKHVHDIVHLQNYLSRHLPKTYHAYLRMESNEYWRCYLVKIAAEVEAKYGRLKPYSIPAQIYYKQKDKISNVILKRRHFNEKNITFEHLVNKDDFKVIDEYNRLATVIKNEMKAELKQHCQNPQNHPKYREEWGLFFTKRSKELESEGKDVSMYDFKPEWKAYFTKRIIQINNDDIKLKCTELKKRLGLETLVPASSQTLSTNDQWPKDKHEVILHDVLKCLFSVGSSLGTFKPSICDLLANVTRMEIEEPKSSEILLDNELNCALLQVIKMKLEDELATGSADCELVIKLKTANKKITALSRYIEIRKGQRDKFDEGIRNEIATALVLQGKTDISQTEFDRLITIVIGKIEESKNSGSSLTAASFLEKLDVSEIKMLASPGTSTESVVNQNAMDHLSEFHLITLLRHYKELSLEEQQGIAIYLKKLEIVAPERIDNLKKLVNIEIEESGSPAENISNETERGLSLPIEKCDDTMDVDIKDEIFGDKTLIEDDHLETENINNDTGMKKETFGTESCNNNTIKKEISEMDYCNIKRDIVLKKDNLEPGCNDDTAIKREISDEMCEIREEKAIKNEIAEESKFHSIKKKIFTNEITEDSKFCSIEEKVIKNERTETNSYINPNNNSNEMCTNTEESLVTVMNTKQEDDVIDLTSSDIEDQVNEQTSNLSTESAKQPQPKPVQKVNEVNKEANVINNSKKNTCVEKINSIATKSTQKVEPAKALKVVKPSPKKRKENANIVKKSTVPIAPNENKPNAKTTKQSRKKPDVKSYRSHLLPRKKKSSYPCNRRKAYPFLSMCLPRINLASPQFTGGNNAHIPYPLKNPYGGFNGNFENCNNYSGSSLFYAYNKGASRKGYRNYK